MSNWQQVMSKQQPNDDKQKANNQQQPNDNKEDFDLLDQLKLNRLIANG